MVPKNSGVALCGSCSGDLPYNVFTHAILDYYFDGRVRYSYFPHRIVVYIMMGIFIGVSKWRRESSKSETV